MNKLPKEKRDKILLIAIGSSVLCAAFWYLVIGSQNGAVRTLRDSILDLENKVYKAELLVKRGATVQADLAQLNEEIHALEAAMIPIEQLTGKKWLYDNLVQFTEDRHDVVPTNLSNDPVIGKQFLPLPKFPYSAATYDVDLRAYFHDFGKFLAEFENSFPFMSILSLQMWPIATPTAAAGRFADNPEDLENSPEREQLRISMKVAVLFKPATGP